MQPAILTLHPTPCPTPPSSPPPSTPTPSPTPSPPRPTTTSSTISAEPFRQPPNPLKIRKNRDHAIIAQISALRPNDSAEAIFAAQIVAAGEQWNDCLHWAQRFLAAEDYTRAAKCRAQAASMMREADRAQRALERMQAARRKLYANPDTTDAAERTEHITMVMLAEALAQMPEPTPAPTPVTPRPAPPAVEAQASLTETPVSKTTDRPRKHKNETPARQPERPRESAARLALIDKFLLAPREPDPNRRYPGESGAQLLARRQPDPTHET